MTRYPLVFLMMAIFPFFGGPVRAGDVDCDAALRAMQPAAFFGPSAACASSQPAFCQALEKLPRDGFEVLADLFDKTPDSIEARRMGEALTACGLDYANLHDRQCQSAFRLEEIDFVLRHCSYEAWSLARAQCERNLDSISPRYYELCRRFGRPILAAPTH